MNSDHTPTDGRAGAVALRPLPDDVATPAMSLAAEPTLDLTGALIRGRLIIAAWVVLALLGALLATLATPKQYDASALLLSTDSEPVRAVEGGADRSLDPERELNTSVALVTLDGIARAAHSVLRFKTTPEALLAAVSARLEGNSRVLAITARDRDPRRAAAIADAFARAYVDFRRTAARTAYLRAIDAADAQLVAMSPDERASATGRALRQRIQDLEVSASGLTGAVQLVQQATPPTSPATPRLKYNLAVALIVGLFAGAGCAIAVASIRRRV
jgi:non-specific protein-tyrosine kinase